MNPSRYGAVGAVRAAVKADLASLDPGPGALVLVACSGGADSLALAGAIAAEASEVARTTRRRGYPIRVGAVVVDHGLQLDSARVAERAAAQCRELGLDPVLIRRVAVIRAPLGLEAAARAARYAALDQAADELGAAAVYLGHTLDDQAEAVLLGLARGSGARSLAGMPAVRGRYRRPMLNLRRAQIELACEFLGLTPWRDPSNTATGLDAPLRSRVRVALLPILADVLGPGAVPGLARSADLLREDADALDSLAAELYAAVRLPETEARAPKALAQPTATSHASLTLDATRLAAAPPALRRRVLRLAALDAGVRAGELTSRHLAALDSLVANWHGQGPLYLPLGLVARRLYGKLLLCPKLDDQQAQPR